MGFLVLFKLLFGEVWDERKQEMENCSPFGMAIGEFI
jgi:hypothetical protein